MKESDFGGEEYPRGLAGVRRAAISRHKEWRRLWRRQFGEETSKKADSVRNDQSRIVIVCALARTAEIATASDGRSYEPLIRTA